MQTSHQVIDSSTLRFRFYSSLISTIILLGGYFKTPFRHFNKPGELKENQEEKSAH